MNETQTEITSLFEEVKQKSEFDFVLTLINYRGIGSKEEMTNLHEWFDAIEFYKRMYREFTGKEKTRIGVLLYSTFFENSDFYNIVGSLCRIKLGYKGSSYLYWKTKNYERLLGTGEKIDLILELLDETNNGNIVTFFKDNHFPEIRNTFFHSAYTLNDEDYILKDSAPIDGETYLNVKTFLYPKIENVISFFDTFKQLYLDSFNSYQEDKIVRGYFPHLTNATIIGSKEGLKGLRVGNAVQYYGVLHDSGIFYNEEYNYWEGKNIRFSFQDRETIEINEQLQRYETKPDIRISNSEFQNLIDKVTERRRQDELDRATLLLIKFGNLRYEKTIEEQHQGKKQSLKKITLPYYKQAVVLNSRVDTKEVKARIIELEKE